MYFFSISLIYVMLQLHYVICSINGYVILCLRFAGGSVTGKPNSLQEAELFCAAGDGSYKLTIVIMQPTAQVN